MKVQTLIMLLAVVGFGYAQPTVVLAADVEWTSAPVLLPASAKGDRRTQLLVEPVNLTSKQVLVFSPFGGDSPLASWEAEPRQGGTFGIKSRGNGNYHWLTSTSEDSKRLASSVYYFSNPGPAPRSLLQQSTGTLEIKPLKLPREHNQYRAKETWVFQASYQGKPLANVSVQLDTSNGTHQTLGTDAQGQVALAFPDDFQPKIEEHQHHGGSHGGHGGMEQQAQFALTVQHEGITSAFNYKYAPDAFTDKAVWPALGIALGGMLLASPLLWRRKKA